MEIRHKQTGALLLIREPRPRRGLDLRGSNLREADLHGADLRHADLRGASLRFADLRGARLVGARLSKSSLQGADLREADLTLADLRAAVLRDADLREARLGCANLSRADLHGADLTGATVERTILFHTDLREARLDGVDLWRAVVQGVLTTRREPVVAEPQPPPTDHGYCDVEGRWWVDVEASRPQPGSADGGVAKAVWTVRFRNLLRVPRWYRLRVEFLDGDGLVIATDGDTARVIEAPAGVEQVLAGETGFAAGGAERVASVRVEVGDA